MIFVEKLSQRTDYGVEASLAETEQGPKMVKVALMLCSCGSGTTQSRRHHRGEPVAILPRSAAASRSVHFVFLATEHSWMFVGPWRPSFSLPSLHRLKLAYNDF